VLHIGGELERAVARLADQPVAIVGARRPSPYGVEVARSLGRGLAAAAVTVVSGLARGIDAAAHEGALDGQAATIAVLPGGADLPYPASARRLHRRIAADGAVISELPPGTRVRRWMFPARSRIIAGLSAMTVVIEARRGSGALLTAGFALQLGRGLGAVPGRITSPLAAGPHELLREGAQLVCGPQDVLDGLFGAGGRQAPVRTAAPLTNPLQALLDGLADGRETSAALARAGLSADAGLAALASLELAGRVRREPGGRFSVLL
jgi:DNA processing protein